MTNVIPKFNVKFTKLSDNPNAVRTTETIGYAPMKPRVGKSFILYADPINPLATYRQITSSIVQEVTEVDNKIVFRTMNSTYQIEILDDEAENSFDNSEGLQS